MTVAIPSCDGVVFVTLRLIMNNLYLITGNDLAQIRGEASKLFRNFAGENPDPFSCDTITEGEGGATPELIFSLIQALQQR